jgi:hypothetical protein
MKRKQTKKTQTKQSTANFKRYVEYSCGDNVAKQFLMSRGSTKCKEVPVRTKVYLLTMQAPDLSSSSLVVDQEKRIKLGNPNTGY